MTDNSSRADRDSPQERQGAWSADLLARIVAATEHVEATLDRAPQWDATMTEFVETVQRRNAMEQRERHRARDGGRRPAEVGATRLRLARRDRRLGRRTDPGALEQPAALAARCLLV